MNILHYQPKRSEVSYFKVLVLKIDADILLAPLRGCVRCERQHYGLHEDEVKKHWREVRKLKYRAFCVCNGNAVNTPKDDKDKEIGRDVPS
jgi:hypothetical protein